MTFLENSNITLTKRGTALGLWIVTLVFVMSLLMEQADATGCRSRFTRQVINYKDCLPKKILTRACVGSCVTRAYISKSNPFKITHTCNQCTEAVTKIRKVKVICPNPEGPAPFRNELIEIAVPRECHCEPCSLKDITINVRHKASVNTNLVREHFIT